MNYVLAIDTTSGTSVSLHHDGELLAKVEDLNSMKHAETVAAAMATVLEQARVQPSKISAVVVGRGPAPFTGLRVGIAAGIMFAEGSGAKLFGVVSLDGIAKQALEQPEIADSLSADSPLLVTADARRSEVYWALYSGLNRNGVPVCIDGPGVMKPAELEALLLERGLTPVRTDLRIAGSQLAALLAAQLKDGSASHDVTALYLREADATVPKDLRAAGKKVSG